MKKNFLFIAFFSGLVFLNLAHGYTLQKIYKCKMKQSMAAYASSNTVYVNQKNLKEINSCDYSLSLSVGLNMYNLPFTKEFDSFDMNSFNLYSDDISISNPLLVAALAQEYDFPEDLVKRISVKNEYEKKFPGELSFYEIFEITKFGSIEKFFNKKTYIQLKLENGAVIKVGDDVNLNKKTIIRVFASCAEYFSLYKDCRSKFDSSYGNY